MVSIHKNKIRWMGYLNFVICFLLILSTDSYPQKKEYPQREIEVFVGAPGSVSDLYSRVLADEFSKILGVPVVVGNKGGALSHLIQCATAKPDGYTLCYYSHSSLYACAMSSKSPVDLFKDFIPLGAWGNFCDIISVEKSSPFKNFEDVIDYAKKNPKKLKCGTGGTHTSSHVVFEMVKQITKADIVMVPFVGGTEVSTALLGKHIDLMALPLAPIRGLLDAGRLRGLLASGKLKDFPNIPVFSEKGLSEAVLVSWAGFFAPLGIPEEVQKKLADTFEKSSKNPKLIEKIEKLGFIPDYLNPVEMTIQLKKDFEKTRTIAKQVGIFE